eukprot:TRINITY_DN67380_c4_g8_i1.p1 TRINITY_DN67380_c4_g8~~TRINITY_DN67380_c4_g8_i1.p1  ORF type:complete len:889 (+),score=24.85 TRINITY_DN67380_c4_g8_i1:27-2693(+)
MAHLSTLFFICLHIVGSLSTEGPDWQNLNSQIYPQPMFNISSLVSNKDGAQWFALNSAPAITTEMYAGFYQLWAPSDLIPKPGSASQLPFRGSNNQNRNFPTVPLCTGRDTNNLFVWSCNEASLKIPSNAQLWTVPLDGGPFTMIKPSPYTPLRAVCCPDVAPKANMHCIGLAMNGSIWERTLGNQFALSNGHLPKELDFSLVAQPDVEGLYYAFQPGGGQFYIIAVNRATGAATVTLKSPNWPGDGPCSSNLNAVFPLRENGADSPVILSCGNCVYYSPSIVKPVLTAIVHNTVSGKPYKVSCAHATETCLALEAEPPQRLYVGHGVTTGLPFIWKLNPIPAGTHPTTVACSAVSVGGRMDIVLSSETNVADASYAVVPATNLKPPYTFKKPYVLPGQSDPVYTPIWPHPTSPGTHGIAMIGPKGSLSATLKTLTEWNNPWQPPVTPLPASLWAKRPVGERSMPLQWQPEMVLLPGGSNVYMALGTNVVYFISEDMTYRECSLPEADSVPIAVAPYGTDGNFVMVASTRDVGKTIDFRVMQTHNCNFEPASHLIIDEGYSVTFAPTMMCSYGKDIWFSGLGRGLYLIRDGTLYPKTGIQAVGLLCRPRYLIYVTCYNPNQACCGCGPSPTMNVVPITMVGDQGQEGLNPTQFTFAEFKISMHLSGGSGLGALTQNALVDPKGYQILHNGKYCPAEFFMAGEFADLIGGCVEQVVINADEGDTQSPLKEDVKKKSKVDSMLGGVRLYNFTDSLSKLWAMSPSQPTFSPDGSFALLSGLSSNSLTAQPAVYLWYGISPSVEWTPMLYRDFHAAWKIVVPVLIVAGALVVVGVLSWKKFAPSHAQEGEDLALLNKGAPNKVSDPEKPEPLKGFDDNSSVLAKDGIDDSKL